jgi:hypothetical protein
LNVAFHFKVDVIEAEYPEAPLYNIPILEKIFRALLAANFNNLHLKIFEGDLLVFDNIYEYGENKINELVEGLLGTQFRNIWRDINPATFRDAIPTSVLYVVLIEGLSTHVRDYLIRFLKAEKSYIGAVQVYSANSYHWSFYKRDLSPKYRFVNKELRILHTMSDENDRDTDLETYWKQLPFTSVQWEDLMLRHTAFDAYESFDHATLVARLDDVLSEHLSQLSDEVLLRLGDLDPRLQDVLFTAYRTFYLIQTSEDIAQVAVSCRRFLEKLADALYPPRNETVKGREVKANMYKNRLWAYVEERLNTLEEERKFVQMGLTDLGKRIDKMYDLANKGVHHDIHFVDLDRLLIALVTITYDLLSLAPPPLELPVEPHLPEISKFIKSIIEEEL